MQTMSDTPDDNDVLDPHLRSKVLVQFWFDVEKIIDFDFKRGLARAFLVWLLPGYGCLLGPAFCFCNLPCLKPNVRDAAKALHVVMLDDAIVFKNDKHPQSCRCDCQDAPALSNIVQMKNIVDIRVQQPAGGCLPKNVLSTVVIQTAGVAQSEIILRGLVDAEFFRRCILAQRNGEPLPPTPDPKVAKYFDEAIAAAKETATTADAPAALASTKKKRSKTLESNREQAPAVSSNEETVTLLREIKDDLKAIRARLDERDGAKKKQDKSGVSE